MANTAVHTTVARRERAALADLFDAVGPDQPTLNEGWLTSDLLHHVIIRERRPVAALSRAIGPLHFWSERVISKIAARPWSAQVDIFRGGPQWFSPVRLDTVDSLLNTAEYFIHHEDVRRGLPGWTVRTLDPETEEAVTDQVKGGFSRLQLKKLGIGVQAQLPDRRTFQLRLGDPAVTLIGAPSELLLWISGRRADCEVDVQGSPAALAMLERALQR